MCPCLLMHNNLNPQRLNSYFLGKNLHKCEIENNMELTFRSLSFLCGPFLPFWFLLFKCAFYWDPMLLQLWLGNRFIFDVFHPSELSTWGTLSNSLLPMLSRFLTLTLDASHCFPFSHVRNPNFFNKCFTPDNLCFLILFCTLNKCSMMHLILLVTWTWAKKDLKLEVNPVAFTSLIL